MAKKVTVAVLGGQTKTYDEIGTIGELKAQLGLGSHTAMVNMESASDSTELGDFDYVTLAPAVKGG